MKRVLIVNKFLYPNGGSETYIFKLGEALQKKGHKVQYFGMQDERNIVGNDVESYTSNMNFHTGKLAKLMYPFKIIYSLEARRAIRRVLDAFQPDVVHLNNFNFQITPSIIYEIKKYEKRSGGKIKIVFTAHDYQLVCPNHMLRCPRTERNCEKCIDGAYINCIKGRCIHGSGVKSILGAVEARFYRIFKAYRHIDTVICPSRFLQTKLEHHPQLKGKTVVMQNFITPLEGDAVRTGEKKGDYLIYFGRYSKEKGIETLLKVCRSLPHIPFVFAGKGPLEEEVEQVKNIENRGFLNGQVLEEVIRRARFSIYPSEWYENCPFSIMESIQLGTPVIGADIGGIGELIDENLTGKLFESGNSEELKSRIEEIWNDSRCIEEYAANCRKRHFTDFESYTDNILEIYEQKKS